jgi:hypothetical protein
MPHRLFFTYNRPENIENHYVVGAGVGAKSRSVRSALRRRSSNNSQGKPCCFKKYGGIEGGKGGSVPHKQVTLKCPAEDKLPFPYPTCTSDGSCCALSDPKPGDPSCNHQPTLQMKNDCFPDCYPKWGSCIGPATKDGAYNKNCADGALATAKAWIQACSYYTPPGRDGRPKDPRCIKDPSSCLASGELPFSEKFCQQRCPVAVGLAHKESLYCPTAISPDWGDTSPFPPRTGPSVIQCNKEVSDGLGQTYAGGYGLWQLDGRNQNFQKNFVEQIENKKWNDSSYADSPSGKGPCWGYVSGFLNHARQEEFVGSGSVGRELLTPIKQAEWTLDETSGDFGVRVVKLPGTDWSELETCAAGWTKPDANPDGSPAHIAATEGVRACTIAMKEYNPNVVIEPDPAHWFNYLHCTHADKRYTCNQTTGACKEDPAGTQTQAACAASCKAPVEKDSWYFLSTTGGGSNGVPVR